MLKSNLILLFSLALIAMITITHADASVQNLASITNEEDSDIIKLQVLTDENEDITHLKLIFKSKDNEIKDVDKYQAHKAAAGIVLYNLDNRDVVKLESKNFSSHQGGEIKLDFLYNGITGSREYKYLDLSRDGDVWKLTDGGKDIKRMHFVSNKKAIVGTIGIKRIETK